MRRLDRLIAFDESAGLLRCEAGVTLAEILDADRAARLVPARGARAPAGCRWAAPSPTTSTARTTTAPAPSARHVTRLELLALQRRARASARPDDPLFQATVGGLGLTGPDPLGRDPAQARARRGHRAWSASGSPDSTAFFELAAEDDAYEYTVAWVDCLARGRATGARDLHAGRPCRRRRAGRLAARRDAAHACRSTPRPACSTDSRCGLFNEAYYRRQLGAGVSVTVPYAPFFFPLDGVGGLDPTVRARRLRPVPVRGAGRARRGAHPRRSSSASADRASPRRSRCSSGSVHARSPGMLSFPRPGITLAVDFAFRGPRTLALLDELDAVVRDAGRRGLPGQGRPHERREASARSSPRLDGSTPTATPKFSSSFWRRVHAA